MLFRINYTFVVENAMKETPYGNSFSKLKSKLKKNYQNLIYFSNKNNKNNKK
jgi:hypothetical protein